MARKINWEISIEGYGPQYDVIAPTRLAALGIAEQQWLKDTADYRESFIDDDGTVIPALVMPIYIARKMMA